MYIVVMFFMFYSRLGLPGYASEVVVFCGGLGTGISWGDDGVNRKLSYE